ncbi:hypothetical protein [Colwellia sp. MEBiC06753]
MFDETLFDETLIDIPFECRHMCWFCGEPSHLYFRFPHQHHIVLACPHPTLTVPSCAECQKIALSIKANSIVQVADAVKTSLIKIYRKHLAIGLNWTPETLAASGFEGGNFEGFQKSAWFMYEVAKARVNYAGWPLSLGGIFIDIDNESTSFDFDGVKYPSIELAIAHYVQVFGLNKQLLIRVLDKIGLARFSEAVRFCRLQVSATPNEANLALAVLD